MSKKGREGTSYFNRMMHRFVEEYKAATGRKTVDHMEVARWVIGKGDWEPPDVDPVKQLGRYISRAERQQYIEDDDKQPVRRMQSYKVKKDDRQLTFWVAMEDATREQIHLSAQQRRNGMIADGVQLDRDVRYFNKRHNKGEPVTVEFNLQPDIEESRLPTHYSEERPEEEADDGCEGT